MVTLFLVNKPLGWLLKPTLVNDSSICCNLWHTLWSLQWKGLCRVLNYERKWPNWRLLVPQGRIDQSDCSLVSNADSFYLQPLLPHIRGLSSVPHVNERDDCLPWNRLWAVIKLSIVCKLQEMKLSIGPLDKLYCFWNWKKFHAFTFSQAQTSLRGGLIWEFHLL